MSDYKEPTPEQPVCCIVIGMAGSGKTTLMKVCFAAAALQR